MSFTPCLLGKGDYGGVGGGGGGVESAKVQKGKRQKDHEKNFVAPAMQLVAIRGATKCGKDRVVHEAN